MGPRDGRSRSRSTRFPSQTWNERRISVAQNQRDTVRVERDHLAAENEDLTTRNNALQSSLTSLLDKNLEALANEMDFGGTERISVYLHRAEQRILEGKARHSANPEYDRFRRDVYEDNEGCLAAALRSGESILSDLPDPSQGHRKWQAVQHEKTNLSTERSEKMNMKARSIGAFAIGPQQHRIGVVVVESTRTNVLDFDKIRAIVSREEAHLVDVLELIGNYSEDAKSLAEEGF